jgi:archaellum component FlaC
MKKQVMKADMKRWVEKFKGAQKQINALVKDNWVDEAKRFAERQGKEVRKLIEADLHKVKTFVEREKRDLEKLQEQIPAELNRWKKLLESQKQDLSSLLGRAGDLAQAQKRSKKKRTASVKRKPASKRSKKSPKPASESAV